MTSPSDADKLRTPNPLCPACGAKRLHAKDEWRLYHPDAGKGTSDPWTKKPASRDRTAK